MISGDVLLLHLFDGVVFGLILALLAVGLSLAFGLLHILNIAHGAIYMVGGILAWYSVTRFGTLWPALLLVPLVVCVGGAVFERTVLRPVEAQPILTMLSTFGLMMILQHAALMVFGAAPQMVPLPIGWHVQIFGYRYPVYRMVLAALAFAVIVLLTQFLRRFTYGKWILAVKQNRELALALGIPVLAVQSLGFGIAVALAGFAGVLAAPIVSVDHEMGLNIIISAFIIAIVGGLGNLKGSALVAVVLGVLENVLVLVVEPSLAKALVFAVVGGIVVVRPFGVLAAAQHLSLK